MNTRLTLNLDPTIARRAKLLARRRGQSLSGLVEEYLRFASPGLEVTSSLSSRVQAIAESLPLPPGAAYDDVREQYLREKLLGADTTATPAKR